MSKYLCTEQKKVEHGLVVISYYAEEMKVQLLKLFETVDGLEDMVDECCHSNGIRWDFRLMLDYSGDVTQKVFDEWGESFCKVGELLQSMDEDSYKQYEDWCKDYTRMEDLIFYILELGWSLESLSAVWKRIDPNQEMEFEWYK